MIRPGDLVKGVEHEIGGFSMKPNRIGLAVSRHYRVSLPYIVVMFGSELCEYPEDRLRRVSDEEDRED